MDSFTTELFSHAYSQFFPNNSPSSFTNFLPGQVILDRHWEVAISEVSYPSMYQNITEGKFMFYDDKLSKTTEAYYRNPGLLSSITDILEAMNTLIQERNNHRDTCITVKVNRVTQKMKVNLATEESSPATFSTDLGPTFGGDVGNDSEYSWVGTVRMNQHLPTIMFASTHS